MTDDAICLSTWCDLPSTVRLTTKKPPSDGVYFAQYKDHPHTLFVYRSPEERISNPERLNLDRRHLTTCPVLKAEERIRLLNYQNNYIVEVTNLSRLPNLIFLDLYNNRIEKLSRDLECVPTLRVLMLGKNRIKHISNLSKLIKLDVLDLHSNTIAKVEQLDALSELRVLNLAGNKLTELDGLSGLQSLTELNVRRNYIDKIGSLQQVQSLQRLFLSNNKIHSLDAIDCFFHLRHLMELSLDGNPIALKDPTAYRRFAVDRLKTLRHLDLKKITDAESRAVAVHSQRMNAQKRAAERHELVDIERKKLEAERHKAIRAAAHQWAEHTADIQNTYTERLYVPISLGPGPVDNTANQIKEPQLKRSLMNTIKKIKKSSSTEYNGAFESGNAVGYYEVEIGCTHRALQLYGEAWECLDSQNIVSSSTAFVCRFVSIDRILKKLQQYVQGFIKLRRATFGDNAIGTLTQVIQLANTFRYTPGLVELTIESNPICGSGLVRPILHSILPSIKQINGLAVSDNDATYTLQLGVFCKHIESLQDTKGICSVRRAANDCDSTKQAVTTTAATNSLRADELQHNLER